MFWGIKDSWNGLLCTKAAQGRTRDHVPQNFDNNFGMIFIFTTFLRRRHLAKPPSPQSPSSPQSPPSPPCRGACTWSAPRSAPRSGRHGVLIGVLVDVPSALMCPNWGFFLIIFQVMTHPRTAGSVRQHTPPSLRSIVLFLFFCSFDGGRFSRIS